MQIAEKSWWKLYSMRKILQYKVQRNYRLLTTAVKYVLGFIVEKNELAKNYPSELYTAKK